MRWNVWLGGLAMLLAATSGCKQQCFLTLDDYKLYQDQMVANLATDPQVVAKPLNESCKAPMTVLDAEREIRYMTLAEAIAIALEQGTIGSPNLNNGPSFNTLGGPQTSTDQVAGFSGVNTGRVTGSDSIRVLRLDPAIAGLNLEASLSKFDATWQSSASWQNTDRPVGTAIDQFQSGQNNAITQNESTVQTGVFKPLPAGGVAGITFGTTYTLTNLNARVNPSYRPTLQFQFEQPLLQGFGVDINQLRSSHPGSILTSNLSNLAPTAEGILVSRIRFDQQRAEFELRVMLMVSNTEFAYWNLYYGYWNLYAAEALLRSTYETLRITEQREAAGLVAQGDLALARGRYEDARSSRIQALFGVTNAEREIRGMLQLRMDDGKRIVPSDQPTVAPFQPNWDIAYQEAMTLRPELFNTRQEVKAQQLALIELKNQLLPDLRFTSTYDINAIGNRLDGPDSSNAFRSLAGNHFNNWSLGLRLNVPIGFRNAYANLRRGELSLVKAYETLRDSEFKIERALGLNYQRVIVNQELIKTNRAARLAYGEQVRVRLALYKAGKKDATLNFVLDAQQQWANALRAEYVSIRDYNDSIVGWEFTKGTALVRNNVHINEGALPSFAQVRAAEHEREKGAALKLREHPLQPVAFTDPFATSMGTTIPPVGAPLPAIMNTMPLMKDAPPVGALTAPATVPVSTGPSVTDLRQRPATPAVETTTPPIGIIGTPTPVPQLDGTALPPIGSGVPATPVRRPTRDSQTPTGFATDGRQ